MRHPYDDENEVTLTPTASCKRTTEPGNREDDFSALRIGWAVSVTIDG
jgi:hypothetical protein